MKRTTRSGLTITYAEFWLDWRTCQGERYPLISTERRNNRSIPLNRKEAKEWWFRRCFGAEFTDDAEVFMLYLLDWTQRPIKPLLLP